MQPLLAVRALGWSCIGFAVGSAVAPRFLAHAMGHGPRPWLPRVLGARDLVIGAGLAGAADPAPWLRARLASEAADAVLHATGAATGAFRPARALAITAGAVALGAIDYALLRGMRTPAGG